MEEIGPEASKRPRLDSFGGAAPMQGVHQQHTESPLPLHNYQTHALRPPSAYNQPLPPSPYDAAHDHRNLPEHLPQGYPHPQSGYTTPVQNTRPFQPESTYSRHGSVSAPTHSPDDGPPLTALRPLNTASANKGQHYPSHPVSEAPSHLGGHPIAYGPPEGYMNGTAHGLPMSTPHDPSQRPPLPGQFASYAESPVGPGGPPYSAGIYGPSQEWMRQQQGPRKNTRALQACDTCRSRKARCDEGKPICAYCKDNNQQCRYKEVAPPKADRAQKEIMDQLKALHEKIEMTNENTRTMNEKIERIEIRLGWPASGQLAEDRPTTSQSGLADDIKNIPLHTSSERKPFVTSLSESTHEQESVEQYDDPNNIPSDLLPQDGVSYGSIVVDHTTGAHRLLRWPTIKSLLKRRPLSEDYVMEMEERKGLIRLYGRGQGRDTYDGAAAGPASPVTSTPSMRSEDVSRSPGSSPPDIWGTALGPPIIQDPRTPTQDHPGGLNPDGSLKLDWPTMERLRESYLKTLHILHPFLNKSRLSRMFQRVLYCTSSSESSHIRSPFLPHNSIVRADTALNKATKRKHSTAAPIESPNEMSTSSSSRGIKEQPLERRTSTAIVLLVMALGKICEHRGPLPGPVPEIQRETSYRDHILRPESPSYYESPRIKPSPTPSSASPSSGVSELRTGGTSRRSSTEQQTFPQLHRPERNVDVIPGLAYFARAGEILGVLNGCQDLIDILAELDLQRSGIERTEQEGEVSYPNGVSEDSTNLVGIDRPEGMVLAYYSFQITLRTTLNKIQMLLYPPGENTGQISLLARDQCEQMLQAWRRLLPQQLRWNDDDPPNANINVARLRAKYYGARYIIHRPFLEFALHSKSLRDSVDRHIGSLPHHHITSPSIPKGTMPPPIREQYRERGGREDQVKEILRSAEHCIEAAFYSTESFDVVRQVAGRLIVTNIFGTAHAQFGNMLVLAATYRSHLGKLVDKANFLRLLDRTITFLSELSSISSTLEKDAETLRHATVSKNFLKVLINPNSANFDIIAVHGLNPKNTEYHAEATWTSGDKLWLRDFLPQSLPNARILLFGYNANVAIETSIAGVREQAINLLNRIASKREDAEDRPIIFVTHSLGSIVVKRALVEAKLDDTYKSVRAATYGIAFFSTPHQGGDFAKLEDIATSIVRGILRKPSNSFLEALTRDSLFSNNLADDFRHSLEDYYVLSFFETLPMGKSGLIVDKKSATLGLPGLRERQIPMEADHADVCKYASADDDNYEQVSFNLVRLVKNAVRNAAERARLAHLNVPSSAPLLEPASLWGLGGVGSAYLAPDFQNSLITVRRSQIDIGYVYWHRKTFLEDSIFWIHGSNLERFSQGFLEIARDCKLPGLEAPSTDHLTLVKTWLSSKQAGQWLMIIDNADDEGTFFGKDTTTTDFHTVSNRPLGEYIAQCHHGAILVTTRNKIVGQKLTRGSCLIEVSTMESCTPVEISRKQLKGGFIESHPYERLSEELGGLPLALAQVATFMQMNSITAEAYLGLITQSDAALTRLLGEQFETSGRDTEIPTSVTTTWAISFEYIQRTCALAAELLSRMAILERQSIPEALIHEDSVDRLDLTKALGILKAFSFVSANEAGDLFDMHRLIHLATRNWLRLTQKIDRWSVSCLVLISQRFPEMELENGYELNRTWDAYLSHSKTVLAHKQLLQASSVCAAELAYKMATVFYVRCKCEVAQIFAAQAFQDSTSILGDGAESTIISMQLLTCTLKAQRRFEDAETLLQQFLNDKLTLTIIAAKETLTDEILLYYRSERN
ncbi:hypothetical protein MMC17_006401 [Xylographa soralifera]|nr:hypothetical protein [Xylographa soralifera]